MQKIRADGVELLGGAAVHRCDPGAQFRTALAAEGLHPGLRVHPNSEAHRHHIRGATRLAEIETQWAAQPAVTTGHNICSLPYRKSCIPLTFAL